MFQKPQRGDITTIKLSIMPGTFSQIYIQIVFAVKGRETLIANNWKSDPIGAIGFDEKYLFVRRSPMENGTINLVF